jgi:hypothetical protein
MDDDFNAGMLLLIVWLVFFGLGALVGGYRKERQMCEKLLIGGDTTIVAQYVCEGRKGW